MTILLAELTHHRWALPVLDRLCKGGGARFGALHRGLAASPGSVREALALLLRLGLARRNPGYGHPLRREYLPAAGPEAAAATAALVDAITVSGRDELLLQKWPLPVLAALSHGEAAFGALRRALPGVTDRVLDAALLRLVEAGLAIRTVAPSRPPAVTYSLTPAAAPAGAAAAALAAILAADLFLPADH